MTRRKQTTHIVVHCSATRPQLNVTADMIREWHLARRFADIGYHVVIQRNGLIEFGRHPDDVGAHVAGHNSTSVGVVLCGGLYSDGTEAVDDFFGLYTPQQDAALAEVLKVLQRAYPSAAILGHRDLSPDLNNDGKIEPQEWLKSCPGFDVAAWCHRWGLQ